jgi:hypothetical protein
VARLASRPPAVETGSREGVVTAPLRDYDFGGVGTAAGAGTGAGGTGVVAAGATAGAGGDRRGGDRRTVETDQDEAGEEIPLHRESVRRRPRNGFVSTAKAS